MEWLFGQKANRAFAEDPEKPYAVNFTNPAAGLVLWTKFVSEAQTLFDAPGFHVGMDEVTMRGALSLPRPKGKILRRPDRGRGESLARPARPARGTTMWMWADMALNHGRCRPRVGQRADPRGRPPPCATGLPKDIVMVDWQYSDLSSFPSLDASSRCGLHQDRRRHLV